jgi:hypothetical protein
MPKKVELYNEERQNIVNKLFQILEINDLNKSFSLHKMDDNPEKQQQILDLEPDVKKYFKCSRWTCMHKKDVQRKWLSMIKYILKDMKIEVDSLHNKEFGTIYNIKF